MKSQLTKRERLFNALNKKEVDRLPWSPVIDNYFISSLPQQGYSFEIIEAMRFIGNDILERHVASPKELTNNIEVRIEKAGGITRYYHETPVGTIHHDTCDTAQTVVESKHRIQTIEDAKVYQYIVENTHFTPDISAYTARAKYIGDDGLPTLSGPASPIQECLQHLAGIENTVYLMGDYPSEMDELFFAIHERNKRCYNVLAQYPCPVVFNYEDTSTTVMSRNMFENYSLPAINDYSKMMCDAGKIFITHMCGKLQGFSELISRCNADGIDSVCPPTTGDVYPWVARRNWPDKVIIGGIEPPALSRMSIEETLCTVVKIIKNMPTFQGFILSTGDAVPFGTPIENMIAVTRLIEKIGAESLTGNFDISIIDEIKKQFIKGELFNE